MSDLISRQAAIKAIEDLQDCRNGFSDTYDKACIIGVIEEVPSIEPIKHGCWEFIGATTRGAAIINIYACSECGYEADTTNYCPNCGALMDGKDGGENE